MARKSVAEQVSDELPVIDGNKLSEMVESGELTEKLRTMLEGDGASTTGPFGLNLTTYDCRVVAVGTPAIRSSGVPVGQATSLKLILTASPDECGSMIRQALFEDHGDQAERREDVKRVTFGKQDFDHDIRISKGGGELLLSPDVIKLTETWTADGQMFAPEAKLTLEVQGLPRSYASGFNALHDWYSVAYQVSFQRRAKALRQPVEDGQTTVDDFVSPELPAVTTDDLEQLPVGANIVIGTDCWRQTQDGFLDLNSDSTKGYVTSRRLIDLLQNGIETGAVVQITDAGDPAPEWVTQLNTALADRVESFDDPDDAEA